MCTIGPGAPAPQNPPPAGDPGQAGGAGPLPPSTAGGGSAAAPAVAGAAGDAAAGASTIAGGPPGSLTAVLQQLVASLQALVAALGGAPIAGGGPVAPAGGPGGGVVQLVGVSGDGRQVPVIKDSAQGMYRLATPTGQNETLTVNEAGHLRQLHFDATGRNVRAFELADRRQIEVQRTPGDDQGMALIGLLDRIVQARETRSTDLKRAFDQDANDSGVANQLDAQRLRMDQDVTAQTRALVEKLRPIGATIDQAEGTRILGMLSRANETGSFNPTEMIRVIMQVDGSARGVPATYAAAVEPLLGRMDQEQERLRIQSEQVAQRANETGAFDEGALKAIADAQEGISRLSAALAANYQLAITNPAAAQSKVAAAASQATLAAAAAALA
jgi:hypothetical protein